MALRFIYIIQLDEASYSKSARLCCSLFFKGVRAFCGKEAWIVWDNSLADENTTKMLKICQKSSVLKVPLVFYIYSPRRIHRRDADENVEELNVGIRSSSIARAITDLVVSPTGELNNQHISFHYKI